MITKPARLVEWKSTLFLLMFLALAAIAFSIWQGWSYIVSRGKQQTLINCAVREHIETVTEMSRRYFSESTVALDIIGETRELQEFAQGHNLFLSDLQDIFWETLTIIPSIFQFRYINNIGQERLRIDRHAEELIFTPPEKLQDKSDRDYFIESMAEPSGTIYVSNLDLNIEHGEVETPWKPTIRLAIPIATDSQASDNHNSTGLLIMNLDIRNLFTSYTAFTEGFQGNLYLVNSNGYWLYGRKPEELWGFVFGKDTGMATEYPDVWKTIAGKNEGEFHSKRETWISTQFVVKDLFPETLTYASPNKIIGYAVVRYQNDDRRLKFFDIIPPLSIILILAFLSFGWTRSVQRQRRVEEQLTDSRKLTSLARLVAGVAHELNTPIGSALTTSTTLFNEAGNIGRKVTGGQVRKSEVTEFINAVSDASRIIDSSLKRAAELVKNFKEVSADQTAERRRAFDLDQYIGEIASTIAHLFKNNQIELELDLQSRAVMDSYPGPISQVIINIVQNALIHGFKNDDTGSITIETRAEKSRSVQIRVQDNGKGIAEDQHEKLFEPFYTTRLGQGGSGLGLHIVHNIVTGVLGGTIEVSSSQEKHETSFIITLPLVAPVPNQKEALSYET